MIDSMTYMRFLEELSDLARALAYIEWNYGGLEPGELVSLDEYVAVKERMAELEQKL